MFRDMCVKRTLVVLRAAPERHIAVWIDGGIEGRLEERGGRRRQSSRRISMMTGASSRRNVAKMGMCICVFEVRCREVLFPVDGAKLWQKFRFCNI